MLRCLPFVFLSALAGAQQTIEVRVVDTAKRPIAGAEVRMTESWRLSSPDSLLSRHQFPLADVLGRATSDAKGSCELAIRERRNHEFMPPRYVLFARAKGYRLDALAIQRDAMPAGPTFEIVLSRVADKTPIRLRLPDGKPAAGVEVRAIAIQSGEGVALIPDEWIEQSTSDADGRVRFSSVRNVATIEIRGPRVGRQVASKLWSNGLDDIRIKKTAKTRLKLTGSEDAVAAARGTRVRIWTKAPSQGAKAAPASEQQVLGYFEGTFGDDGTLVVDALAHGSVIFDFLESDRPHVPKQVWGLRHANDGAELKIPLVPTHAYRGRIVDASSERGIANVVVEVGAASGRHRATTGADGSYRLRTPQPTRVAIVALPARYRHPGRPVRPPGPDERELETMPIARGRSIFGKVVGPDGAAIANAWVVARWKETSRWGERRRWSTAFSDEKGEFEIVGLPKGKVPKLKARSADAESTEVDAVEDGRTVLRVESAAQLVAEGSVRDSSGGPLSGAVVHIETQEIPKGRAVGGAKQRNLPQIQTTDAKGRWRTAVPTGFDYRVRIQSPGFADAGSAWHRPDANRVRFETTLRKLHTLRAKVVRGSQPVAGAKVVCPARDRSAATNDDGSFAIPDLPEGQALVVITANGKRTVHSLADGQTIDLDRPRARRKGTDMAFEQRATLAKRLLEPTIRRLEKSGKLDSDLRLWQALAVIDPTGTLARLDTRGLAVHWYDDAVRRKVIDALAASDLDEAFAVCETLRAADRRALLLARLAKTYGGPNARRALFEALLSARRISKPDMRLCVMARIGEGFLDIGDRETALRVFEEAEPLVAQLPNKEWPGYARACFATDTAVLDLERSLKIVAGMDQFSRGRHHANIAHELAPTDPAASERVLKMLPGGGASAAVRVCAAMCKKDAKRAHAIAKSVRSSGTRALALAAMAAELGSKPLLDEAIAAAIGAGSDNATPSVAMAALLPFAARVAPERVEDIVARAIGMRRPRGTDPRDGWKRELETDCKIAVLLSQFDLDAARWVLREAIRARHYLVTDRKKYRPEALFLALALVDPNLAVRTTSEIPADHPQHNFRVRGMMQQLVAGALVCRTQEQLHEKIRRVASLPDMGEDQ